MNSPTWLADSSKHVSFHLDDDPIKMVDVGAAGAPPPHQKCLAAVSHYLGFDPDQRLPQSGNLFGFRKHTTLGYAITASDAGEVTFNLTENPECSSVLRPDMEETGRYSIGGFFKVIGKKSVPAITLNRALAQADISAVDWLKLDTQGTDLDILQSLSAEQLAQVLVVDVEPGVSAFYANENRLSEIHEYMLSHGFWLADLNQQRFPRMSVATKNSVQLTAEQLNSLGQNPFALELQYFRTIESLRSRPTTTRDCYVFWLLAMANGHRSYAIEIASAGVAHGLSKPLSEELIRISLEESQRIVAAGQETPIERILRLVTPPVLTKLVRRIVGPRNS